MHVHTHTWLAATPRMHMQAKELQIKDVNYIVKGKEVIIVDEFTGRTMAGRRWSDGLHQVGLRGVRFWRMSAQACGAWVLCKKVVSSWVIDWNGWIAGKPNE